MWIRLRRFAHKITFLFEHERFHRELAEELSTHESLKLAEHSSHGVEPREAVRRTRLDMGNRTLAAEQAADVRAFAPLEQLAQDARFAVRILRKNISFSAMATLSIALGIGGTTAVFSLLNALLIKPLPFGDPARLVRITEFFPKALLVHLSQNSRTMDIASASSGVDLNVTGHGPAFRVSASPVSANLFSILGAPVQFGRSFEPGEDQPGRDRVAILSQESWMRRFGADPAIVGRILVVNGVERRIVGVMPPGFAFPSAAVELWIPAPIDPRQQVDYWAGEFTPLIARLRPGATIDQARDEVKALSRDVWRMFPWPMPRGWNANATVIPLQTDLAGETRGRLFLLFGVVAAVLVIACANVAGLLTARGAARRKELAMRAALGAGRSRIVCQLLTESVVLAGAAGALGLALGSFGLRLFRTVVAADLPGASRIGLDWRVVGFAAALALLAGLSFGTAPALWASRLDIVQAVKSGGQRSSNVASIAFRSWLIVGEIALTLVLLVGATLLLRALHAFSIINPGFDSRQVLAVKVSPDASFCSEPARCVAFYGRMLSESRGVSSVVDAALANDVPLDGSASSLAVDVEDHPKTADFPAPMFWAGAISPGYLRVMAIPLLSGRSFNEQDTRDSERVVLIDSATAKRFWPAQNPIGKHLKSASEARWRTVVGVVADVRQFNLSNRAPAGITGAMYMPYTQAIDRDGRIPQVMNLIVKTAVYAPRSADDVHHFAASLNYDVPVGRAVYLNRIIADSLSNLRSTAFLLLAFACSALCLAAVGTYGLMSYAVSQRGYEIALRMSVGATRVDILRLILNRSVLLAAVGLSAGTIVAVSVARAISSIVSGVPAADPFVYAWIAVFLLSVVVAASAVPAVRASRIDPVRALRGE